MKRYEILPACSAAVVAMALATFAVEIPVDVPAFPASAMPTALSPMAAI